MFINYKSYVFETHSCTAEWKKLVSYSPGLEKLDLNGVNCGITEEGPHHLTENDLEDLEDETVLKYGKYYDQFRKRYSFIKKGQYPIVFFKKQYMACSGCSTRSLFNFGTVRNEEKSRR